MLMSSVVAVALQVGSAMATPLDSQFYDAALCRPPYSLQSATVLDAAAAKLTKPDTSSPLGAAIYKIPHQIGRDGFESNEVFFANGAVGVLINGLRADELGAKYGLKPETSDLPGTSTRGYARVLPVEEQPAEGLAGPGKVSIVARESAALPGKTMLACEFAPD